MKVTFMLNGRAVSYDARPDEMLLEVLRREGWLGARRGCEDNNCGACTVIVDGKTVLACATFAAQVEGRSVTTIEGLGDPANPHPIQRAFVDAGAVQCGFCMPGMILSTKVLLDETPTPNLEAIQDALDGNLCRCTGYVKVYDAVQRAAAALAAGEETT